MIKIMLFLLIFIQTAFGYKLPVTPKILVLKNGLKVVMYSNKSTSTVSGRVVYKVGARFEETGYTGISHMLEHMMFKGTKKVGTKNFKKDSILWLKLDTAFNNIKLAKKNNDSINIKKYNAVYSTLIKNVDKIDIKNHYWKLLDSEGGSGVNAYTTKDATVFTTDLPSNKLELYLAIESDRMENAFFREFYSEREVVREERRMRYETRPWGMAYEALFSNAYNNHPYGAPVIGWASDIMAYTRDYLNKYHKKYYAPNNAILVLVGNIDYKKTENLVKKYFGKIQSSKIEKRHITKEKKHNSYKDIKIKAKTAPFAMVTFNLYDNSMKTAAVYDIIQVMLSEGKSSIMYKHFIKNHIALQADGFNYTMVDPGLFIFDLKPATNVSIDSLKSQLWVVLEKLKKGDFRDWEIQKAKNNLDTYYASKFETNNSMASLFGDYELFGGIDKIKLYMDYVEKTTKKDIVKYAKDIFYPQNETVVEVSK